MFFDPLYMGVMLVGAVLSFGAQAWVKAAFSKWSQVPTGRGMTGADVARAILRAEGIGNVTIEPVQGMLSDHYDPRSKTLRLSPDVFNGRTIASASTLKIEDYDGHRGNIEAAKRIGATIGKLAVDAGVEQVVFDRNGYLFHGRVKALADAARAGGLEF